MAENGTLDLSREANGKPAQVADGFWIVASEHQNSRCLAVEPVDDAWSILSSLLGQFIGVGQQRVDDASTLGYARRGVHDQVRRFVDDDDRIVFEDDLERDILG